MKLVNYRCKECQKDVEEIFFSDEKIPELLRQRCPQCEKANTLERYNFKNNAQVQKFKGEW